MWDVQESLFVAMWSSWGPFKFFFAISVRFFHFCQTFFAAAQHYSTDWHVSTTNRACFYHNTQSVHNGRLIQGGSGAHDRIRGILCWCWKVKGENHQRNPQNLSLQKTRFWDLKLFRILGIHANSQSTCSKHYWQLALSTVIKYEWQVAQEISRLVTLLNFC